MRAWLRLAPVLAGLTGCMNTGGDPVKEFAAALIVAPIAVPMLAANGWHEPGYLPPLPMARSYPGDDVPLYRGVDKTPDMLKADQDFIASVKQLGWSRAKGSEVSWRHGWIALQAGDYTTAARRMNQAWLLDPSNANTFDALGVIAYRRDHDAARAEELFRQSLAAREPGHCANTEWGRMLLAEERPAEAVAHLRLGTDESCRSLEARKMLIIALDAAGDKRSACAEAKRYKFGQYGIDTLSKEAIRRTADCAALQ